MNPNVGSGDRIEIPGKHKIRQAVRGFLAFIQGVFQDEASYHWSEDLESSGLLIREGRDRDPSKFEKLPAILVNSGDISWVNPNASTVAHRSDHWIGKMNQVSFSLVARFFGKDDEEAENLAWMTFLLLPNFMDLLARYSGVTVLGSPGMVPFEERGAEGAMYPGVQMQARCAMMVGVRKNLRPDDGVVDSAFKRARMVFEMSTPRPEHQDEVGLVREHLPAHALDLVIRRNRYGGIQVLPPDADRSLDEGMTLNLEEELEETDG